MMTHSGWGRSRQRQIVARKLEFANKMLAESRELILQIFEPDTTAEPMKHGSAQEISNRVYRIQEQIAELKRLVKQ